MAAPRAMYERVFVNFCQMRKNVAVLDDVITYKKVNPVMVQ